LLVPLNLFTEVTPYTPGTVISHEVVVPIVVGFFKIDSKSQVTSADPSTVLAELPTVKVLAVFHLEAVSAFPIKFPLKLSATTSSNL
jgi:hypothetical protein